MKLENFTDKEIFMELLKRLQVTGTDTPVFLNRVYLGAGIDSESDDVVHINRRTPKLLIDSYYEAEIIAKFDGDDINKVLIISWA